MTTPPWSWNLQPELMKMRLPRVMFFPKSEEIEIRDLERFQGEQAIIHHADPEPPDFEACARVEQHMKYWRILANYLDTLADALQPTGIPCFGPTAQAGQLESSKAFTKAFCDRYGLPTGAYVFICTIHPSTMIATSSSTKRTRQAGVSEAGLMTAVLPQISAGNTFQAKFGAGQYPLFTIEAGTDPGQTEDVPAVGSPSLLVEDASMGEELAIASAPWRYDHGAPTVAPSCVGKIAS